jgi:hypothetical protein
MSGFQSGEHNFILWNMALYNYVGEYQSFGEIYCFHLQN